MVISRTTLVSSSLAKWQSNTPSSIADPASRLMWQRLIRREKPTGPTDRHLLPPRKPFPAEIWLQILGDCLDDSRLLLALTKTCWFFNQISQPHLYEAVELDGPPASHFWTLRQHNRVTLFERSLKTRPDLGTFVRSLDLLRVVHLPEYPRVLSKLDQLPNLETLRIRHFRIDAELCRSLHRHPRLTTVEFSHCKLHKSLAFANCDNWDSPISKLIILYPMYSYPDPGDFWNILVPAKLRSLELKEDSLLWPSGDSMIPIMITWLKTLWLQTLIINTLPTSIIHFLISSPQLRHLSIGCPTDPAMLVSFSSFPADAVPLLEHYGGPVELLEILLRNRPVHSIALGFSDFPTDFDNIDIPVIMQLPSVPVTELEIWHPEAWYPEVCRFTCHCLDFWGLSKWLSALSSVTDLCTLRFPRYWQYMGREFAEEISKACPSVRELNLMHERWVMVGLNKWERIPKH